MELCTSGEISTLLELLVQDDVAISNLMDYANERVQSPFRAACCLAIMLEDNLLPVLHRGVALFLMYELGKAE